MLQWKSLAFATETSGLKNIKYLLSGVLQKKKKFSIPHLWFFVFGIWVFAHIFNCIKQIFIGCLLLSEILLIMPEITL